MNKSRVLCFTREALQDAIYSEKLAYSMHLAVDEGNGKIQILNHNAGILYAKATQNEDGTLNAMSLQKPWLFQDKNGNYCVIAIRILAPKQKDESSRGKLLLFTSTDLLSYREYGLINLPETEYIEDCCCIYSEAKNSYQIYWQTEQGIWFQTETMELTSDLSRLDKTETQIPALEHIETEIPGAVPRNWLSVPGELAKRLIRKLTTPVNTANIVPEIVEVASIEQISSIMATAYYSDGSTVEKKVDWDIDVIPKGQSGTYEISGRIHQDHFIFPIAINRADPCIGRWNGKYYYIATNDADNNHTLYMREADTIEGLVNAPEALILDSDTYPHIGNLLWAPEFHVIRDRLYLFHAATPRDFIQEQSHVMVLRVGGNPMERSDWSEPKRVVRKDGSMLYGAQGITLDMTEFEVEGRCYCIWSQRQFVPVDQGAWLYIAELNPEEPWKLISDPVLLSMPEYGWANNHTFVDEGPFALITDRKIFVSFSSAAVDSTYVVGLLSIDPGKDLLDASNWTKCNYPILSCRSVEGEYGTGHNAYVTDEDGLVWNTYHAKPGVEGPRSSGIRRVHMDAEGYPVLDVTEERDLVQKIAKVHMKVVIR